MPQQRQLAWLCEPRQHAAATAPRAGAAPSAVEVDAAPRAGAAPLAIEDGTKPRTDAQSAGPPDGAAEAQPASDSADKQRGDTPAETVKQQVARLKALLGKGDGTPPKKRGRVAAKRPAAAVASDLTTTPAMKRPAAAAAAGPRSGEKGALRFPGVNCEAIQYKGYRIYHSPGRFRLLKIGEKVDKQFSHKVMGPREAWRELVKHLETQLGA